MLLHSLLSACILPPMGFIWLILVGLWCRRRSLVYLGLLLCYALSTPMFAWCLTKPLEVWPSVSVDALRSVDAMVVLGGGKRAAPEFGAMDLSANSLMRLRYAAYLARQSAKPLLLSGGAPHGGEPEGHLEKPSRAVGGQGAPRAEPETVQGVRRGDEHVATQPFDCAAGFSRCPEARVMAQVLQRDFGLTPHWIESQSNTTQENAADSAQILLPAGVKRIALVTQAWHMRRAVAEFTARGFVVLPAPCGFAQRPSIGLLPSGAAMQQSWLALREWLGWLVYQIDH